MPVYLPVLKAILPLIGPLVSAATPMFTKKAGGASADPGTQIQQIAELQEAVRKNSEAVRLLAEQLETAVAAIDEREAAAQDALHVLLAQLDALQECQVGADGAIQKLAKDGQVTKGIAAVAILVSLGIAALSLIR